MFKNLCFAVMLSAMSTAALAADNQPKSRTASAKLMVSAVIVSADPTDCTDCIVTVTEPNADENTEGKVLIEW